MGAPHVTTSLDRPVAPPTPAGALEALGCSLRAAPSLLLILDYDGTLVPLAPVPDLAAPDAPLLDLLSRLARRPATFVHVASGRPRAGLEAWLGSLPIGLHAEHGAWSRRPGAVAWTGRVEPAPRWRAAAERLLRDVTARTPGSLVEEKSSGLAWHYRLAGAGVAARGLAELRTLAAEALAGEPVELLDGDQVLEIRPAGVHKGLVVTSLLAEAPPGTMVAAFGDDRTDEDLFAAVPPGGLAVHVGEGSSVAPFRLANPAEVRALLASLVGPERAAPADGAAPPPPHPPGTTRLDA